MAWGGISKEWAVSGMCSRIKHLMLRLRQGAGSDVKAADTAAAPGGGLARRAR